MKTFQQFLVERNIETRTILLNLAKSLIKVCIDNFETYYDADTTSLIIPANVIKELIKEVSNGSDYFNQLEKNITKPLIILFKSPELYKVTSRQSYNEISNTITLFSLPNKSDIISSLKDVDPIIIHELGHYYQKMYSPGIGLQPYKDVTAHYKPYNINIPGKEYFLKDNELDAELFVINDQLKKITANVSTYTDYLLKLRRNSYFNQFDTIIDYLINPESKDSNWVKIYKKMALRLDKIFKYYYNSGHLRTTKKVNKPFNVPIISGAHTSLPKVLLTSSDNISFYKLCFNKVIKPKIKTYPLLLDTLIAICYNLNAFHKIAETIAVEDEISSSTIVISCILNASHILLKIVNNHIKQLRDDKNNVTQNLEDIISLYNTNNECLNDLKICRHFFMTLVNGKDKVTTILQFLEKFKTTNKYSNNWINSIAYNHLLDLEKFEPSYELTNEFNSIITYFKRIKPKEEITGAYRQILIRSKNKDDTKYSNVILDLSNKDFIDICSEVSGHIFTLIQDKIETIFKYDQPSIYGVLRSCLVIPIKQIISGLQKSIYKTTLLTNINETLTIAFKLDNDDRKISKDSLILWPVGSFIDVHAKGELASGQSHNPIVYYKRSMDPKNFYCQRNKGSLHNEITNYLKARLKNT
jgi:hypothetical protein